MLEGIIVYLLLSPLSNRLYHFIPRIYPSYCQRGLFMMDSENTRSTSASVELSEPQTDLLVQLEKLLSLVTSDATMMRTLCDQASEAARNFMTTFMEFSDAGTTQTSKRKRISRRDPSYRPSKSARIVEKTGQ